MFSIHKMSSILAQFQPSGGKKTMKEITLNPSSHFWLSKPWASFFGPNKLDFPLKWCHVHATSNWLELILDSHVKTLSPIYDSWTIGLFHFHGPSWKVTFRIVSPTFHIWVPNSKSCIQDGWLVVSHASPISVWRKIVCLFCLSHWNLQNHGISCFSRGSWS